MPDWAAPGGLARGSREGRRPAAGLPGVQRHHAGRAEERHRHWLSRPFGAGALSGKPAAVIGTAFGQFGGVWAQDEARKAVGIAGATVLEELKLFIPGSLVRFAETHQKDDAEVAGQRTAVLGGIRAAAGSN